MKVLKFSFQNSKHLKVIENMEGLKWRVLEKLSHLSHIFLVATLIDLVMMQYGTASV